MIDICQSVNKLKIKLVLFFQYFDGWQCLQQFSIGLIAQCAKQIFLRFVYDDERGFIQTQFIINTIINKYCSNMRSGENEILSLDFTNIGVQN